MKKFLLSLFAVACLLPSATSRAQEWKPVSNRLMTTFAEKVTPTNALPEYPRPQMQRAQWQNLNGLWDYAIAPRTASAPQNYAGKILVPFCPESALSGVGKVLQPTQRLWYRRTFTIPPNWNGQRVLLHFGAVDYESTLWINGALVGSHAGGFEPFSFDVTDFLRAGNNELRMSVWDPTDQGEQPRGKQALEPKGIWYTPVSGIWQTAWLEPVPQELYLAELRLTPDVDNKRLRVVALANTATGDDGYGVRITASDAGRTVATTVMRVNREGWLDIPNPRLWSPDAPVLYDLKAELVRVQNPQTGRGGGSGRPPIPRFGAAERAAYTQAAVQGAALDTVQSYFGMRKISLGPGALPNQPVIQLNDKPLFQHGPLDQGWWPDGLQTPPSDAAMVWEIGWLKKAGFNMLRKHIKIEPARYYYNCDRLGLLVWQDMPSGFNEALRNGRNDEGEPVRLSASREQHELELRRMIDVLHNHPSIVMWVVHNEGWGQYETESLAQWVKSADPSRLVNAVSGWLDEPVGDIFDIHTYQEVPNQPANKPRRAIVIGEYGGVGWPVEGHLWNPEMRNWGYQTYHNQADYLAALRKKIEALARMRTQAGLSAAVYTQTTDVEGEVNGLMTYDRKFIKVTPEILAEMNKPLYQTP